MTDIKERGDQMEEACGVFGIYAQDESINVAEAAYYGLFALQHRGQESAGIAVADGRGIKHYRNLGLVPEVFDEEILHGLTGRISIGHVRYSTFGSKDVINSQPLVARCKIGMLALAHNGNLVNADALRAQMEDDGAIFQTSVDTEVILSLIARESSKGLIEAVRSMMEKVRGSYALVLLTKDKLIGIRDPYGIRPLCLGRVGNSFVLASESCALDAVGAEFVRDVQPGEIVVIDADGIHSMHVKTPMRSRLCLFEFVYFARPDSVIDGINVYQSRVEAGKRLAIDDDVEADMVIGVPDSALAAAMGSLAVQALRSDDEALRQTAEELRQMTDYMVFQIDEELRSREPYDKRRNDPTATRNDLDIALRVASDIPNEVVYIMCRCIELMKEVVDKGDELTACSALAAVHLSVAAIRCMQAELLSYAKEMDDDVFGYTIVREAELNLANHQELIDGLVEELTRRLTREKK